MSYSISRRQRRLVDKKLQLPLIAALLLQATLVSALFIGLVLWLGHQARALVEQHLSAQQLLQVSAPLATVSRLLLVGLGLALLLTLAVQLRLGLRASHRLAGPALRAKRALLEMASSQASQRVVFRDDDDQARLAQALNVRLSRLDRGLSLVKGEIPFLETSLQTLREGIAAGSRAPVEEEARQLEESLSHIRDPWPRYETESASPAPPPPPRWLRLLRRKRLLVRGRSQTRFLGALLLRLVVCLGLFALLGSYHLQRVRGTLSVVTPDTGVKQTKEALGQLTTRFYLASGGLTLLSVILAGYGGLVISHRLAGPVHRLIQHLKQPPAEPGSFSFRRKDRLDSLAAALTAAEEGQTRRQEAITSTVEALRVRAESLATGSASPPPVELCDQMQQLLELLAASVKPPISLDAGEGFADILPGDIKAQALGRDRF